MTVAELLTASRASHAAYRELHEEAAKAKRKKPEGWKATIRTAHLLRQQAHEMDPQHVDPAWSEDPAHAAHDALMAFYAQQLGLTT